MKRGGRDEVAKVAHPSAHLAHVALDEAISYAVAFIYEQTSSGMEVLSELPYPMLHIRDG